MTRVSLLGYGVLIGILLGGLTSAEALRCGQSIIALGYTKSEVVDRCGEPTAIDQRYEEEIRGTFFDPLTFRVNENRFLRIKQRVRHRSPATLP